MTLNRFNGSERRAYVRLEKSLPVRFKISENPASETYAATTKNLSQGGICLEIHPNNEALIEKLLTADQKIGIDINTLIPQPNNAVSDTSLWVNGRADWARESDSPHQIFSVGLEFVDLTDEARQRIREYLVDQFLQQYPQHR